MLADEAVEFFQSRGLTALVSFLATARTLSLRAASKLCGRSFRKIQSDLDELERALGFKLFRRTPTGLVMTPRCTPVLAVAATIESQLSSLARMSKAARSEAREITVAVTEGLGLFWVLPRLSEFRDTYPHLHLRLQIGMDLPNMSSLQTDISLQLKEPDVPSLKRQRLATMHICLAASPDYLAKRGRPKSLADFAQHSFVAQIDAQVSDMSIYDEMLGADGARNVSVVVNSSYAQVIAAEAGLGIVPVPTYAFPFGARLEAIEAGEHISLPIWLAYHGDLQDDPDIKLTIAWLQTLFEPKDYPWFRRNVVPPASFRSMMGGEKFDRLIERISTRKNTEPVSNGLDQAAMEARPHGGTPH
jgi:DNA-binding transcriptional LysR family regulator